MIKRTIPIVYIVIISFFAKAHALNQDVLNEWREVLKSTVGQAQIYNRIRTDYDRKDIFSKEYLSDDELSQFVSQDTVIVLYEYHIGGWYFEQVRIWNHTCEKIIGIGPKYENENSGKEVGIKITADPITKIDWRKEDMILSDLPSSDPMAADIILCRHIYNWDLQIPPNIIISLDESESKRYFYDAFRIIRKEDGKFSIEHYCFPKSIPNRKP